MNLFDVTLQLNSFPIKEARRLLKEVQQKGEDEFKIYIDSKKQEIVNYHLMHNSFYKSFGKKVDVKDWNSIPVMTKSDLQKLVI